MVIPTRKKTLQKRRLACPESAREDPVIGERDFWLIQCGLGKKLWLDIF